MNKFLKLDLLFLLVLGSFFSCKDAKVCEEKDVGIKSDDQTKRALFGTWQAISEFEESKGYNIYPIHPQPNLDSYRLFAFTEDGNFYMATKSIDNSNGKTYLMRQKEFDATYTIKGNEMNMLDKNGKDSAYFTLRGVYLTTFVKNYFGKLQVRDFKKVESPTIQEIIEAQTE